MRWLKVFGPPLFLTILLIFYNEFAIFYLAFWKCQWPEREDCRGNDRCNVDVLKVFMISDPHLLGRLKGHWLDKLKREWQMKQSFDISTSIFQPQFVFFLGDLMDEGQWAGKEQFTLYADRFRELFGGGDAEKTDEKEGWRIVTVAGNHDLGFHYAIMPNTVEMFRKEFRRGLIDEIRIKNHRFILINSMAMHGDGCRLCHEAKIQLDEISNKNYTDRPIVLQHFPLFRLKNFLCRRRRLLKKQKGQLLRKSDKSCEKVDELHEIDLKEQYREQWDTLSKEASQKIVKSLNPRAIFGGHTHKMCKKRWKLKDGREFDEYTLNSFSWRNGDRPAIFLVRIDKETVLVSSCRLPSESLQITVYIIGLIVIICLFIYLLINNYCKNLKKRRCSGLLVMYNRSQEKCE